MIGKNKATKNIQKLNALLSILAVDEKIIELALSSNFRDFEDAIQYYVAIENNIEYLITRNVKDYKLAQISILTAEEFLVLYKNQL
jgi:predicted nucleic acid-binding protein